MTQAKHKALPAAGPGVVLSLLLCWIVPRRGDGARGTLLYRSGRLAP